MKAIERIYKYIDLKGLKAIPFEKKTGLSNGYLGKQLARKADLGEGILMKIIENCPDINPEWLLTGKGEMLKDPIEDIFKRRENFKTDDERKRELFNSFGDISSGDERLQAMVANLERMNEMLTKENQLQDKVIAGLEFKITTLEKTIKESKKTTNEPTIYQRVAEPAPELIKKQHK